MGFELDRFLADCVAAASGPSPERTIREAVARAVEDSTGVANALGTAKRAGVEPLHVADDLTVLNVVWAPRMTLRPHNHNMWAVIGVYGGREDNVFWRRVGSGDSASIETASTRSVDAGEACPLGRDVIHSVTNPSSRMTGAIHVYGGDFFETARSEWDPDLLVERPYDVAANMKGFQEANAGWEAREGS